MFDRTKERITKFEEDHEAVRKVRLHVKKHRAKYGLAVGAGIGVGATIIVMKRFGMPTLANSPSVLASVSHEARATIGDVSESVVSVDLSQHVVQNIHQQFGGHCCKIIQDASDPSKMWPMIKTFCEQVAEENNTTPDKVRRMVERYWAGKADNVHGYYPQRYGVTTTG